MEQNKNVLMLPIILPDYLDSTKLPKEETLSLIALISEMTK